MKIIFLNNNLTRFQKFHWAPNHNGNKDNQKLGASSNIIKRNKLKTFNLKKESVSMKNLRRKLTMKKNYL